MKTLAGSSRHDVTALQCQRTRIVYWFIDFDGKWLCFEVTAQHGYKIIVYLLFSYFFDVLLYLPSLVFLLPLGEAHRSFSGVTNLSQLISMCCNPTRRKPW
jgi:hypothetical protein